MRCLFSGCLSRDDDFDIDYVMSCLEDKVRYREVRQFLNFKHRIRGDMHGNTLLHFAIAENHLAAAIYLLTISNKLQLNERDTFPTSHSTPLILAAKTHATDVAMLLIGMGAQLDLTDYRGFTALHYAAIYRNNRLIDALISAGANLDNVDDFGQTAADYYCKTIEINELDYQYGLIAQDKMTPYWDWDKTYSATRNQSLSALRWFMPQVLINGAYDVNKKLLCSDQQLHLYHRDVKTLLEMDLSVLLKFHVNQPVHDMRLYRLMCETFCEQRNLLPTVFAATIAHTIDRKKIKLA